PSLLLFRARARNHPRPQWPPRRRGREEEQEQEDDGDPPHPPPDHPRRHRRHPHRSRHPPRPPHPPPPHQQPPRLAHHRRHQRHPHPTPRQPPTPHPPHTHRTLPRAHPTRRPLPVLRSPTKGSLMNATDQRRHLAPVPTNTNTAEPPHDIAAEQIDIGATLLTRDAINDTADHLTAADFYRPAHQVIYDTILDMDGHNEPVTPVSVHAELVKRGARAITALYLHDCVTAVPVAANAGYYARIVAERAAFRRLVQAGTRIAQLGYSGTGDIDTVLDLARTEADRATEPTTTHTHTELTIGDRMPGYIDRLENGRDATNLIPVPYNTLRRLVPGFAPGQLIAVGARPG